MHFVHEGRGAPPLLFVHGFACSHEDWRLQLEFFRARHQAIACDLRGHGATPGRAQECSIEHYGGDVAALVNHLNLTGCVLIGHSMGTRVVLEAARINPDPVAGVVLIDGSRQASGDPDEAEASIRAAIVSMGFDAFVEHAFRNMFFEWSSVAERALARARRLPADVGTTLWSRMVRWDAEHMDAAFAALRAPIMVIQSTVIDASRTRVPLQRGQTSPWLDYVRRRVPSARIEIIPAGHFVQLEAAAEANRVIAEFAATLR